MYIETYAFKKEHENLYYEFYSEGPNGNIKKVVEYYKFSTEDGTELYNLAFGDWDEVKNEINDLSISNNLDRDKVLATVASTIVDFLENHAEAIIIATGSTTARSRLYQISINKFWSEIEPIFEILGYKDNDWQPFKKGINYISFLLKAK